MSGGQNDLDLKTQFELTLLKPKVNYEDINFELLRFGSRLATIGKVGESNIPLAAFKVIGNENSIEVLVADGEKLKFGNCTIKIEVGFKEEIINGKYPQFVRIFLYFKSDFLKSKIKVSGQRSKKSRRKC